MKNNTRKINIITGWNEEETIEAEFIGRGSFATCYRVDSMVYSYVNHGRVESDYSKEAISEFASDDNIHIPQIKKLGDYETGLNSGILYSMPFYEKLTASHVTAWKQYNTLKSAWNKNNVYGSKGNLSWYEWNVKLIESLRGNISESIIEALESINDACSNYGLDYRFEFPKQNLKVDSNGNLILLDVIFNVLALPKNRGGRN